jgi:small-conductance mechanosensitive channel
MMLIFKILAWVISIVFISFLWIHSINLTKPVYNHKNHVWEEDPQARIISNICIALIIITSFFLGYWYT